MSAIRRHAHLLPPAVGLLLTLLSGAVLWGQYRARDLPLAERRLLPVAAKEITGFSIFHAGTLSVELTQDHDNNWVVSLPAQGITDVADASAIQALQALVEMAIKNPVAAIDPAAAGLAPEPAAKLVVHAGDRTFSLLMGKVDKHKRIRYLASGRAPARVHAVAMDITRVMNRSPLSFRNLDLFTLGRQPPRRLTLILPASAKAKQRRLVLQRRANNWFITTPVRWPAAPGQVQSLLRLLQELRARGIRAPAISDPSSLGLDADKAAAIIVRSAKGEQAIRMQEQPDKRILALCTGRKPVYEIDRSLWTRLAYAGTGSRGGNWFDHYRLRTLDLLGGRKPFQIYLRSRAGVLRLSHQGGADRSKWVASGARDFEVEDKAVMVLMETLGTLSISRFTSEQPQLAKYGLDHPAMRIDCMDAGGARICGISLGKPNAEARSLAAIDGRPQVVELHPAISAVLCQPFVFYRSRDLVTFDYSRAWEITISKGSRRRVYRSASNGFWQLLIPRTKLLERDSNKMVLLIARLSRLRCRGFEGENIKNLGRFGLDPAKIRVIVTVRPKGGGLDSARSALDLLIGSPVNQGEGREKRNGSKRVKSRMRYACLAGTRTVFLLEPRTVEAVCHDYQ